MSHLHHVASLSLLPQSHSPRRVQVAKGRAQVILAEGVKQTFAPPHGGNEVLLLGRGGKKASQTPRHVGHSVLALPGPTELGGGGLSSQEQHQRPLPFFYEFTQLSLGE